MGFLHAAIGNVARGREAGDLMDVALQWGGTAAHGNAQHGDRDVAVWYGGIDVGIETASEDLILGCKLLDWDGGRFLFVYHSLWGFDSAKNDIIF